MDLGIDGKRAAVAAASDGLGLAAARGLVAAGVDVAICGRDPGRLDAAVASLTQAEGPRVAGIVADLATPDGAVGFADGARDALGGIDIVVPNAGGPPAGPSDAHGIDAYRAAVEQNLLVTVALCQATVPDMVARGWGRVVAITSATVRQPAPGMALSNTARAGATGYLKTLALEVAGAGVTVNSVQPGPHATERLRALHGDLDRAAAGVPTRVLGRPEDFGQVVAFLCSDQARFITGVALPVDGGASRGLQ